MPERGGCSSPADTNRLTPEAMKRGRIVVVAGAEEKSDKLHRHRRPVVRSAGSLKNSASGALLKRPPAFHGNK